MDKIVERMTRAVAQCSSRRSFLGYLGRVVLGASVIPLLPVDRIAATANAAEKKGIDDHTTCDSWKDCPGDAFLCTCCVGGSTDFPPWPPPSPPSSAATS